MEPCLRVAEPISNGFEEELSCKSSALKVNEPETCRVGGGFECNICLDLVQDPVVTFCGHLYCWNCIYKWIITFPKDPDDQNPHCPVCKTEVSEKTMIPLYGRGEASHPSKQDVTIIPKRPSTPVSISDWLSPFDRLPHWSYATGNHTTSAPVVDPMIGVLGGMVYAGMFGHSDTALYAYPSSYRYTSSLWQHRMAQVNRSLGRVCFFLCCCTVMCLLLF